jgi:hypothetical protein
MVRSEYGMSASGGLGYLDSEPGKLIYLLGELGHAALHKSSLDDFEAASRDRETTRYGGC